MNSRKRKKERKQKRQSDLLLYLEESLISQKKKDVNY